jgi:hypothetical protein
MPKTIDNTNKLLKFIDEKYQKNELDNDSLVQLIEHAGSYLNLKTIPKYCKEKRMSYNGVKKHRNVKVLFDVKFVIDNE